MNYMLARLWYMGYRSYVRKGSSFLHTAGIAGGSRSGSLLNAQNQRQRARHCLINVLLMPQSAPEKTNYKSEVHYITVHVPLFCPTPPYGRNKHPTLIFSQRNPSEHHAACYLYSSAVGYRRMNPWPTSELLRKTPIFTLATI